jgi:hypothetical protein
MRFVLLTLVLAGGLSAQRANAPTDPVRTVAARLELERYKAHIKGLTQFGDRIQGSAIRHVPVPLDVGVPEAPQLFLNPVDRIAVALRSLHSIPKLRQTFDVSLVSSQFKATDDSTHRVWRRRPSLSKKPQ